MYKSEIEKALANDDPGCAELLEEAMKLLDNLGKNGFACTVTEDRWDRCDVKLAYVPCVDDAGNKCFIPVWIFSQSEYNEECW